MDLNERIKNQLGEMLFTITVQAQMIEELQAKLAAAVPPTGAFSNAPSTV